MPKRVPKAEKFDFYSTAEECAKAAAPIFMRNRWRWTRCGIPREADILESLNQLKAIADGEKGFVGSPVESGRLIYDEGRFGHEKPR